MNFLNPVIVRYTHTVHVVVDALIAISAGAYAICGALGVILPANGQPAHYILGIGAALLLGSQWLRSASAKLETIDPAAPVTPTVTATITGASTNVTTLTPPPMP